jgi:predicted NBD/HSP70 family sugar kinase
VATTTSDIRTASRFEVLRGVYAAGSTTRQALAAAGPLSFATVSNVVAELLDAGVLVETAYEASAGGRPRARLGVNAGRGRLAGVAVSETHVRVEVFDLALQQVSSDQRPLRLAEVGAEELVAAITAGVTTAIAGSPAERSEAPGAGRDGAHESGVLGAGVSLPGYVWSRSGAVPLFDGMGAAGGGALGGRLARELGLPMVTDNPLKAAALAELWFGAGLGARTLVTVTLGTGAGAGVALRGALLRGATDSAGEWGHTTLVLDGEHCRCGARGCVEAYVGAPAILRRWGRPAADELTGMAELAAAVRAADPVAQSIVQEIGRYLGAGLANLVNIFNPDIVVLGGWVMDQLGEWLLPAARATAAARALARPFAATTIQRSLISAHRTCLGMAAFALENFLRDAGVPSSRSTPIPVRH